jgi:radical SAM superfamily enzyme YgiQ (UPF0313 family)
VKILLVAGEPDPITSLVNKRGIPEPLALEYLASAVPDHEVNILDLRVGGSLTEAISQFDPDIVGISALTPTVYQSLATLKQVKEMSPRITTVIGGPHPTILPFDCQQDEVDIIVQGEGEQAFAEIVDRLQNNASLDSVAGIRYRDNGEWKETAPRVLAALDSYNVPARHLTERYREAYSRLGFGKMVSMLSSRGCSRRCSFCSIWRFHDGKYRKREPEKIIQELLERPEENVAFIDDDSFGDLNRMERFRELVVQKVPQKRYFFNSRAETIAMNSDFFSRWAAAGMLMVFVGWESFSNAELRDINKSATAEQNRKAVEICQKNGIGIVGSLMIRPNYTLDDFQRVKDDLDALGLYQVTISCLTPFPGTVLYEKVKDQIITNNWEHFDCSHPVLKTSLALNEFYEQYADLFRFIYKRASQYLPEEFIGFYSEAADIIESRCS